MGGKHAGLAFTQFVSGWPNGLLTARIHSEISTWVVTVVNILTITSGDMCTLRILWEILALYGVQDYK